MPLSRSTFGGYGAAMKLFTGLAVAVAVVLGGSSPALAVDTPHASPASITSSGEQVPGAVTTIKVKTTGTGTNFSGTYRYSDGTRLIAGQGTTVRLQRKTPTGWETVTTDTADRNGNLVYGTVHSNYVQTWRLAPDLLTDSPNYVLSREVKVARHGRAASRVTFPTLGFRENKHIALNGYYTYRSWWITSGPDRGKQGYAEPLNTHLQIQYWTGTAWKTKRTVLTEDRNSEGVNLFTDFPTNYATASTWRWYYPGSATRTPAISKTLTR